MIVLTGNPGVGVDNRAITKALADLNEAVGDRVILTAGKMHASGILSEAGEKILTKEDAETFIEAGQMSFYFRHLVLFRDLPWSMQLN